MLDYQRSLGNRATAALLARDPKPESKTTETIKVGDNLSLEIAQEAQQLVKKGPLDDKALRTLRTKALRGDETLNPDERMFLTALLDADNAKLLVATKLAKGTTITFSYAKGTTTRHVADLDRPTADTDTSDEAIERQLVKFAGGDAGLQKKAKAVMAFARREGVAGSVVNAAIASASDGTAGDLVAAAAVYAIGKSAGHPMAAEVLAGRVKVDLRKISSAGRYTPTPRSDAKGDTLSVPSVPDPENLDDRGTVVHELTHAGQDAAEKPAGLRHPREPKDLEQEAYTTEATYELKEVAKLTDAKARATAIGQLVKTWGDERSGAMAVAAKKDPKLLPVAQELSKAVRKINSKVADQFDVLLAGEEEDAVRALRRVATTSQISETDGFAGETPLDSMATLTSGKATVGRRVETTYGIRYARFTVGVELTKELAQAGWAATLTGPLDAAGLRKLHAIALSNWQSTIDDNERMFMAALMNPENAKSFHVDHPYGFFADDHVSFTAASITAANRQIVQNVGRNDVPAARDEGGPHVEGDTRELDRQIREMAGAFAATANSALKLADKTGISHSAVYFAMLNGASDSTPDDRAYAGVAYVLAVQAGIDVASDILQRKLKVDAVPRDYLKQLDKDAEGAYFGRGNTLKGDTLYLPWDTDPERLDERGTIVHELKHAHTDKEKAEVTVAQDEARSFEAEMRYVVGQIKPLTGAARTQAINEGSKGAGRLEILAAIGAIRDDQDPPDPDSVTVIEELNKVVKNNVADLAPYLAMPILRLYDEELAAVADRYSKRKPKSRSTTDAFSGESALD